MPFKLALTFKYAAVSVLMLAALPPVLCKDVAPVKDTPVKAAAPTAAVTTKAIPTLPTNGWSAYQTSSLLGDQDAYVSASGVKIVDRRNGNVVTAAAPAWKVYAFNTVTRRICSYTVKTYPGIGSQIRTITGGVSLGALPLKQTAKTTLRGVATLELQTPKTYVAKLIKDKEHESADPSFVQSAQMLIAEKISPPEPACTVLCKFYGVPVKPAMPIQFKFINTHGDLNTVLLTSEVKQIRLESADFVEPKGFAVVADAGKLLDAPVKQLPKRKVIEIIKRR